MSRSALTFPIPRSLRVLAAPRELFLEVAAAGKGFGALFGLLALEYLLSRPLEAASHVMRLGFSASAGVLGLWTSYVHFALLPAAVVFALGVALYYVLRLSGRGRLELWTAASVLAYAWVPHTLLVAAGIIVARGGLDHPALPQYPFTHNPLGFVGFAVKAALCFGPTLTLGAVAVRTMWNRGATAAQPESRRWLTAAPWVAMALVVAALGITGQRLGRDWRQARPLMPGDRVPAFTLSGLDGPGFVYSGASGNVLLLDFWASWCGPCVASMPHLNSMSRDLSARGFRLVSINVEPDNLEGVRSFVSKHELSFPVYVDNGSLQQRFQVQSLPTLFLVDPQGVVREVFIGSVSAEGLRRSVEDRLSPSSSW